ncbi:unnamed protein product [Diatraea saccharalis]|uniref:TIL domain-containing protein n=1 Tax=Diatraea saccharalis TaxID=40085 RepID=A0A9P0C7Z1_9NEOP|nr:unnamed protein product [Diatraea saccharalis]
MLLIFILFGLMNHSWGSSLVEKTYALKCPLIKGCRPTCAVPNPQNCPAVERVKVNIEGCQCQDGYILSEEGGKCIRIEDCPQDIGCNGDPHAVVKYRPAACPSTCSNPDNVNCKRLSISIGCQCAFGYIKSASDGKCIPVDQCPGGDPCGPNGTFVYCGFRCPNQYCPQDDSPFQIACKPGRDCPPGCGCKINYKRLSYDDDRCILASECPPVECTRPNEVWSSCPSDCLAENCENVNDPFTVCNTLLLNCQPKCVCADGYYRNSSGICIPGKECEGYNPCLSRCAPTCADPNPQNCGKEFNNNCCQDGYILSERNGTCIRINQCPNGCNGDPNAVAKQCPAIRPPTCKDPKGANTLEACLSYGCGCAPGYIKSETDGNCILPSQCPGGDPCGPNGTFVPCAFGCPDQYCPRNDNRFKVACMPPYPCPSGCACKSNHKRLSYNDNRCISTLDCPPVNCTRPNEVWSPCPSNCRSEDCRNVNDEPRFCIALATNCQPKCICANGYFRNGSGICVPAKECDGYNPCLSSCAPTCAEPNPSCGKSTVTQKNDCCAEGYVLSERNGKCIRIEECPNGCNGDPNAVVKRCPALTPATCKDPKSINPQEECLSLGCECAPGYIKSETNGQCILADECPGGNPCGPNGTFVQCAFRCPDQYCPRTDSPFQVACLPPLNCPAGCTCKSNHKRLSSSDDRCILAPDCPQVKCTRKNEVWSPCPSNCRSEDCRNVNDEPRFCIALAGNCRPRCICIEGYYRNSMGVCVPADQCEGYNPCLSECAPTCDNPNPLNCDSYVKNSCCRQGYILSERRGKCIKIEECPTNVGCNGDPNAVVRTCPTPCPSTCDQPNAFPCKKMCLDVGCQCADGYLQLEAGGKCVLPDECPVGNPCGKNATFMPCRSDCPSTYCPVDDSRAVEDCNVPNPCLSGCVCRVNHRRLRRGDDQCIVSSDCPPVKCTRQNEEWSSCPSACLQESCEDAGKKPITCNTLLLNCQPRCVCCKGYYRNDTDICVSEKECACQ